MSNPLFDARNTDLKAMPRIDDKALESMIDLYVGIGDFKTARGLALLYDAQRNM